MITTQKSALKMTNAVCLCRKLVVCDKDGRLTISLTCSFFEGAGYALWVKGIDLRIRALQRSKTLEMFQVLAYII